MADVNIIPKVRCYGSKSRLDFTDLCPKCAQAALDAAADVLKARRGEGEVA